MHRSKGDERPKVASIGDECAIAASINALWVQKACFYRALSQRPPSPGQDTGRPSHHTGRTHALSRPRPRYQQHSHTDSGSHRPAWAQKYTAKGPRGPSMTSTGVSNTLDSTSPVMISSGAPNSMTAPSLTAQMWSA